MGGSPQQAPSHRRRAVPAPAAGASPAGRAPAEHRFSFASGVRGEAAPACWPLPASRQVLLRSGCRRSGDAPQAAALGSWPAAAPVPVGTDRRLLLPGSPGEAACCSPESGHKSCASMWFHFDPLMFASLPWPASPRVPGCLVCHTFVPSRHRTGAVEPPQVMELLGSVHSCGSLRRTGTPKTRGTQPWERAC